MLLGTASRLCCPHFIAKLRGCPRCSSSRPWYGVHCTQQRCGVMAAFAQISKDLLWGQDHCRETPPGQFLVQHRGRAIHCDLRPLEPLVHDSHWGWEGHRHVSQAQSNRGGGAAAESHHGGGASQSHGAGPLPQRIGGTSAAMDLEGNEASSQRGLFLSSKF